MSHSVRFVGCKTEWLWGVHNLFMSKCPVFLINAPRPELADLNVTCLCTNVQFQADVTLCLTQHCTTADQAVAVDLKSQCLAG